MKFLKYLKSKYWDSVSRLKRLVVVVATLLVLGSALPVLILSDRIVKLQRAIVDVSQSVNQLSQYQ